MSSSEIDDMIDSAPGGGDLRGEDAAPEEGEVPEGKPDEPARKRAGPLRLKAAVILPLLFAVAAGVYYFTIDGIIAGQLVTQGANFAGEGGEAQVGEVHFSIFGPKLTIREYEVWQNLPDRNVHEVAYVEEAVFDVDFWPLLERRLVVNEMSATEVRLAEPIREEEEPESDVPTDTSNPDLNDYLEDVKDILESEELRDVQDWLNKLREYMDKEEDSEAKAPVEQVKEVGPAARAWYVVEALRREKAKPRVVVKKAAVNEVAFTFGEPDEAVYAHKVTDLVLSAESVSSDPIAYAQAMKFTAAGNLDGRDDKRVELGLTVRFDPDELVTLEQVNGQAAFASLPIDTLVDPGVFGDALREAALTITHFAPAHQGMAGRTRIQLAGLVRPPDFEKASRANFALWFGGFRDGENAGFAPSGIAINVEDFPLGPVLKLAGGSPIPIKHNNATVTFGTCDLDGRMDGPGAALTWHDGFNVNLRLKVNGMEFADPQGELAGLPGTFMVRGLNRVIADMGGLDVVVGFAGGKDDVALDLKRPGLRAFADAVVNALTLTAPEIKSMVDLPFEVSSNATFDLTSVNPDGSRRDPALSVKNEARHDLNDLRVAVNVRDLAASPKTGQDTVLGLPAAEFCNAFNTFMGSLGDEGLTLRSRVMNAEGRFSPALESPGTRGLLDGMVNTLRYSGTELNTNFDLPFKFDDKATVTASSVNPDGKVRTIDGPDSDSSELRDLTVAVILKDGFAEKKPGRNTIMGMPADHFTFAWNKLQGSVGEDGFPMRITLYNDKGEFEPAMSKPDEEELLEIMGKAVGIDDFEANFNKLAERYADEFPAFKEGGLKVAEEIAKGGIKLPGKDGEGDPPEVPDIPDVPDRPKFPWEK